jgi:hypothetical protein
MLSETIVFSQSVSGQNLLSVMQDMPSMGFKKTFWYCILTALEEFLFTRCALHENNTVARMNGSVRVFTIHCLLYGRIIHPSAYGFICFYYTVCSLRNAMKKESGRFYKYRPLIL